MGNLTHSSYRYSWCIKPACISCGHYAENKPWLHPAEIYDSQRRMRQGRTWVAATLTQWPGAPANHPTRDSSHTCKPLLQAAGTLADVIKSNRFRQLQGTWPKDIKTRAKGRSGWWWNINQFHGRNYWCGMHLNLTQALCLKVKRRRDSVVRWRRAFRWFKLFYPTNILIALPNL